MLIKRSKNRTMSNPAISVIIPAYEEQKTIGLVLNQTISVMDDLKYPYEILVVDDGSKDQTNQIASQHKVTVIANGRNQGKGHALRHGFEHANGDIIITMDSDGEHDPKDIPRLLEPVLNGYDLSTGSRYLGDGKDSTYRINRIGNFIFNAAISVLTGQKITDSQSGFRAIKKSVLKELNLTSSGYEIESEMTVKCLRRGYGLHEHPIRFVRRRYNLSKLKVLNDGTKILRAILRSAFTS